MLCLYWEFLDPSWCDYFFLDTDFLSDICCDGKVLVHFGPFAGLVVVFRRSGQKTENYVNDVHYLHCRKMLAQSME